MSEALVKKQSRFAWMLARLIVVAQNAGYDITLGEVWRSPEQARIYAASGQGIARSLHCDRLAVDINLFKDGKYLKDLESYRMLGEWWELQSNDCAWGGRFKKADPCHFSICHGGRK